MRKNSLAILLLILFALLPACAKDVKNDDRPERPEWIDKPEPNFVGRCVSHVKSTVEQEKCAYKEGLANLARVKSMAVNGNMPEKRLATGKNSMPGGTVIDKWFDSSADIMYVLIKQD